MCSWHPEIALNALLRISTLLMAHEHVISSIYTSKTSDNSRIIITGTIAVKLYKLEVKKDKTSKERIFF